MKRKLTSWRDEDAPPPQGHPPQSPPEPFDGWEIFEVNKLSTWACPAACPTETRPLAPPALRATRAASMPAMMQALLGWEQVLEQPNDLSLLSTILFSRWFAINCWFFSVNGYWKSGFVTCANGFVVCVSRYFFSTQMLFSSFEQTFCSQGGTFYHGQKLQSSKST